jgi:hypothetical protein
MQQKDRVLPSVTQRTAATHPASSQQHPLPQHFQRLFQFLDSLKPPVTPPSGMMSWKVEGEEWIRKDDKVAR